jgi:hypothetical protein
VCRRRRRCCCDPQAVCESGLQLRQILRLLKLRGHQLYPRVPSPVFEMYKQRGIQVDANKRKNVIAILSMTVVAWGGGIPVDCFLFENYHMDPSQQEHYGNLMLNQISLKWCDFKNAPQRQPLQNI